MAEAGEEQARDAVEQAQNQGQQAQQSMSEAAQQARNGEPQEASESAQQAADAMSQMSEQLQQGQEQMAQQNEQANQEALEQTATDALSLAREQTGLQDRMRGASPQELAEMRSDEAALLQGVQNMANQLAGETSGDQGSNEVAGQMGQAMEAIQETLDAVGESAGRHTVSRQRCGAGCRQRSIKLPSWRRRLPRSRGEGLRGSLEKRSWSGFSRLPSNRAP